MNEVLETIYARRSVRAFTDKQVPDEVIKEVIKAGFHAACGVNAQATRFAVVSDRKKLKGYSDKAKKLFMQETKTTGEAKEHLHKMLENEEYNIFSNAPTAIFVFETQNAVTAVEDASLAMGNMMLAAKSLGLGTCWIGFAASLSADKGFVDDTRSEGMRHLGTLTIGYPAKDSKPTPRGEVTILNWIK